MPKKPFMKAQVKFFADNGQQTFGYVRDFTEEELANIPDPTLATMVGGSFGTFIANAQQAFAEKGQGNG